MDSQKPKSIVNRLVSGLKEKTVKLAESKLQGTFQLAEVPEESILGFVESAVHLGAQRLEVRIQGNDLFISHVCKKLTETEISQLNRGTQDLPFLSKAFRVHLGKDDGQTELHILTDIGMSAA